MTIIGVHFYFACSDILYHPFIWRRNDHLKTSVDEIQWIEVAGSYSRIVNLRHVEKPLEFEGV